MRVFVAGGTGVIGRRAVEQLVAAGHEVTAVARTEEKAAALRAQGAQPVTVDLFDAEAVKAAAAGHQAVVNLATAIPPSSRTALRPAWRENDRLRTEASQHLARAAVAAGAEVFVQESVALLYADGGNAWLAEDAPVAATAQTRSALAAEGHAAAFTGESEGGRGVALRFASFVADDSGFVQQFLAMARHGVLPLLGRPDGYESFIHIDDAARAVVAALDCPPGVYNVAEDVPATRQEHAEAFAAALGRPVALLPGWTGRMLRLDVLARSRREANGRLREAAAWSPEHPEIRSVWASLLEGSDVRARA